MLWDQNFIMKRKLNPNKYLKHIVTDLINALPGNSSVNTVEHATIEEAVFYVDPTDAPVDWLDSGRVICVYCRSMSVPRLYICKSPGEQTVTSYG
jgi:hypothetical protein